MTSISMSPTLCRLMAVAVVAAALVCTPRLSYAQNQTPAQPPAGAKPAQPAADNKTPPAPAPPPAEPLYISPIAVQHIQLQLLSMGYPVPAVNGGWGDNTSAAVALFQAAKGLDPGGDLDEQTLVALGLPEVLAGEIPAGAKPVASVAAAGNGAPLTASPQLTRVVQNKLTEGGHPTDNVFGIWMAGSEAAARAFQKSKNLDQTGAVDLRLIHTLGLTDALIAPTLGAKTKYDAVVPILSDSALPFMGAPLSISPAGIRQVQLALQQKGYRDTAVDGKWTEQSAAIMKKFQESQKLEPTGSLNLSTLRALGFTHPLRDLDQPAPPRPPS